jgi:hypothetical protein
MLFRHECLQGIRDGRITVAFRRWRRRPTVRTGGTLLTGAGELSIVSVAVVDASSISEADAQQAGYASRERLLSELNRRPEGGEIYRVQLGALRPDPRIAVRETSPTESEIQDTLERLRRLDSRAPDGAWTRRTLDVIRRNPGLRAADLCRLMDQDKEPFKVNVRKLKNLGLTESLEIGYRLSPRGAAVLRACGVRF